MEFFFLFFFLPGADMCHVYMGTLGEGAGKRCPEFEQGSAVCALLIVALRPQKP